MIFSGKKSNLIVVIVCLSALVLLTLKGFEVYYEIKANQATESVKTELKMVKIELQEVRESINKIDSSRLDVNRNIDNINDNFNEKMKDNLKKLKELKKIKNENITIDNPL